MNAASVLGAIRERGIEVVADGQRLRCIAPPGALTEELSARIREYKAEILELLAEATRRPDAGSDIPQTSGKGHFPLSFTQRRTVLAGRASGALCTALMLRGTLDQPALAETLRRIVARHMTLRMRFYLDAETAEQEALPEVPVDFPTIDLSGYEEGERAERLHHLLSELSRTKFDVSMPPPFCFSLVRLGPFQHVLRVAFSVLIFDGWSFDVFWRDLCEGYAAVTKGDPWPPAALPACYQDFVVWQHKRVTQEIAHQTKFWKTALGDELPPLPLPTDRPRPRTANTKGKRIPFELPTETAVAVRRFAHQHALTPQIVMLASLYALLARMTSARDIVIASPVDARTRSSIEGLIGAFVNLLLLRIKVDPGRTFADFVDSVRELCLAAYDHQDLPLEQLDVRSPRAREGGLSPAFQVEFSYQQVSQRASHMGKLLLSQFAMEADSTTNDLTLWVKDGGERIAGAFEFRLDLFDHETIEHWMSCYKHFLRELVRSPEQPMHEIDFLGSERQRILVRLAQASTTPPEWAALRLGSARNEEPLQLQVVDDEDQPRPFGIPGHLVVKRNRSLHRVGVQARLRHDGALTEVSSAAAPRAKVTPGKPTDACTELEMRICLLFAQLLGLPSVGIEQDYFELGGNSLVAVRLFGAIQEQFGVHLPMATILEASTPRALAHTINQNAKRESCVVRLKEGSDGPRLFLIHDGDGETLLYRSLALRMPPHVPVYGIEPLRVGRVTMAHTTIEEMAKHYLDEIRKRQAQGPYFVGGLCAGGVIAFEIARQLEGQGQEVRHLALVEAAPPRAQKQTTANARRWQRFSGLFRDPSFATVVETARQGAQKLNSYLAYEMRERCRRARVRALRLLLRHVFPLGKDWPQVLAPPTVREVYALAVRDYVPSKLHRTQAVLYRAMSGEAGDLPLVKILVDPLFGWQELFSRKVKSVDVPGGHGTLLREPYVSVVASHLHASLPAPHGLSRQEPDRGHALSISYLGG